MLILVESSASIPESWAKFPSSVPPAMATLLCPEMEMRLVAFAPGRAAMVP
ncbi:MAG TPA: hypothetical protein VK596_08195 [Edaphobacter sp.]|nr:hypothetical protein [Edaphobacter sp.]